MKEIIQFNIGNTKYCVFKEEVLSVEKNQTIHRLPLMQKYIAGMAFINNRVSTLADLGACIGLTPIINNKEDLILLISEQDDISGFAVQGNCNDLSISDDEVLSFPGYLKIPFIDKCVIHNEIPVPLINIKDLFNHVKQTDYKPSETEYIARDISNPDPELNNFKVIECGTETFALPAEGIKENLLDTDNIIRLGMTPLYISGILYYDGRVFPIIHLSSRMKLEEEGKGDRVLVIDINGGYAFQIDSLKETIDKHETAIHPLPPIVRSSWMKHAIVINNSIIPVILPGRLASSNFDRSDEPAVPDRYKPDPKVFSQIGKEDMEVIEFSLLGVPHSVPISEVESTIEYKPCRRIPDVKQIVIGITEHNRELLPVLDLAMCFGKSSPVTPQWEMILINNGDFRAFVITEKLIGTRMIPASMQRELPIHLPNKIVYGCYTDKSNNRVRLILNIEALAVYFNKKLVCEISKSFFGNLKDICTGIVPETADTGKLKEIEEVKFKYAGKEETGEETVKRTGIEEVKPEYRKKEETEKEALKPPAIQEVKYEYREKEETSKEAVKQTEKEQEEQEKEENELPIKAETEQKEPESIVLVQEPKITEHVEPEIEKPGQNNVPEPETGAEMPEPAATEEPGNMTDIAHIIDSTYITKDEKETTGEKAEPEEKKEDTVIKEEEPERQPSLTQIKDDSAAKLQKSYYYTGSETDTQEPDVQGSYSKKNIIITAIIIISVIIIFIIFDNIKQLTDKGKSVTSIKEKKPVIQTIKKKYEKVIKEKKTEKIIRGKEYKKENIPPAFSYQYKVYKVKKGDTLFKITRSYTGQGYDYWKVAKENKIRNPDLIFPGQIVKIKVKKQK